MIEIIEWILFSIICASILTFDCIDDLFRLLAKVKIFSICTFNAESCLCKTKKARLAEKRKEWNLIKAYINTFIEIGETNTRIGINYEDNLKRLKEKGFRVLLDNELHHMYYVSWGEGK